MRKTTILLASTCAVALAGAAAAKVPAEVAARLGKDLTPFGAEVAGNADGSIPAWDGGLTAPPSGVSFDPNAKGYPDPFASDAPLYTVTSGNAGSYGDKLTEGYKTLLAKKSGYKMPVYQSRRSCGYPSFVYDANKKNATIGELLKTSDGQLDGNGVSGAIMGAPFPILSNGLEAVWNHTLRYRSFKLTRQFAAFPVQTSGDPLSGKITFQDEAILRWSDPSKARAEDLNNISLYYIANTIAPARLAGNVVLVHESLNAAVEPRKAWQYNPGTRRVRRAPDISFDNPGTNTDGLSTSDAFDGYNGSPERYDWQLIGKSEKIVPYNNYKMANSTYAELVLNGSINQDLMRYELHRVWTTQATLRPGTRHVYSRRVNHQDEDNYSILAVDLYDGRGELWRMQEEPQIAYYHVPLCGLAGEIVYDLQDGRYLAGSLRNEEPPVNYTANELNEARYSPDAIRRLGTR
ncbi:MAG: DUF1329 domain-containing protein [Micropepsaceae bacterium]